jgi:hypothetical protein
VASPVDDDLFEELVAERGHAELLAVVRHQPVVREIERTHDADDCGFLAGERGNRGDLPLPLQVPQPFRRAPGDEHVFHQDLMEFGIGRSAGGRALCLSQLGHVATPARVPRSLPMVR